MLLELLLPRRCACCGLPGADVCAACLAALPRVRPPLCARCGAPTQWPVRRCVECSGRRLGFETARAAVQYDGTVRRLVAAWKERGLRRIARDVARLVLDALPPPDADAVVFVPPDGDRVLERGHYPAAALASALAEGWGLPLAPVLARMPGGRRQRCLSLADRRRNVREAFRTARAPPRRVVLVDDVYTTGATASEAARVLRRGGSVRVDVVTFARTTRHH